MKKIWISLLLLALVVGLAVAGCQATRAGYKSAPYWSVQAEGQFELRDYPALTVVETSMTAGRRDGGDGSFLRLFRFISGGNEAKQKIAMTTPLFMSGNETNATMAFIMPAGLKPAEVPKPSDGTVTVRELPAGRFAVLRYRGARSAAREAESLARLQAWLAAKRWVAASSPVYGYFDPPWIPGFLRRNEVMLRTDAGK